MLRPQNSMRATRCEEPPRGDRGLRDEQGYRPVRRHDQGNLVVIVMKILVGAVRGRNDRLTTT